MRRAKSMRAASTLNSDSRTRSVVGRVPPRRHRDSPPAERAGDDAGQLTTTSRSPPSTCAVSDTATRADGARLRAR